VINLNRSKLTLAKPPPDGTARGLASLYLRCSSRDLPASQPTADPQPSSPHLLKESNVHNIPEFVPASLSCPGGALPRHQDFCFPKLKLTRP